MKTPRILKRIQRILQAKSPDPWEYEQLLWLWIAERAMPYEAQQVWKQLPTKPQMAKKTELCLLEAVGKLLQPLSLNEGCRSYRKPWRNVSYSPQSPIGDYHWAWTAAHVVCARRCARPFVEGFAALCAKWTSDQHTDRDSNPYSDLVRHTEWDSGWLLGIEVMVQTKQPREEQELRRWILTHEKELAASPPS